MKPAYKKLEFGSFAEIEVYKAFSSLIGSDETIEREKFMFAGGTRGYYADIVLPHGCKRLKMPPKTIVEIKGTLLFDTIHRYLEMYKTNKADWDVSAFCIVYINSHVPDEFIAKYDNKDFRIISLNEIPGLSDTNADTVEKFHEEWEDERDNLITKARDKFSIGKNTLFLGAGVSIDAGLPTWDELLKKMLHKYKRRKHNIGRGDYKRVEKVCAGSSIITARYIRTGLGVSTSDKEFDSMIHSILYKKVNQSQLINEITNMVVSNKVESVVTYNYDDLIEIELSKKGVPNFSVFGGNRALYGELPVYHVHGIVTMDAKSGIYSTPVLSEEDYHNIYKEAFHWSNIEQLHALDRTTCFFIGFSMSDPNLRRLLEISQSKGDGGKNHYVFLRRSNFTNDSNRDMENLTILKNMMNDLGLNVIWFKDFNELPQLLKRIY